MPVSASASDPIPALSSTGPTPALTPSDGGTPATTVPATPGHDICTREHALYAFDCLAAKFAKREHVEPPFDNARDK
jgi:hypothetical protein